MDIKSSVAYLIAYIDGDMLKDKDISMQLVFDLEKQISELQEKLIYCEKLREEENEQWRSLHEKDVDKLHRRNLQIKNMEKSIPPTNMWRYILSNAEANIASRTTIDAEDKKVLDYIAKELAK